MTAGALTVSRTFDSRYQLSGIQAGSVMNLTLTHDGAGNVKTVSGLTKPPLASGTSAYSHTANRLISATGVSEATYSHDNSGNIVSDGTRTFTYNQNHRLTRVSAGSDVIAEYEYDAFGRRMRKIAGGETVCFIYDVNSLLIGETDGDGNPLRDYVYLNGQPAAMKVYGEGAGWYYFLNDHLGTPQKLVDASGNVVWEAGYLPFGDVQIGRADVENNLRFPGQYYDAETGLHYNWHRYYDPGSGRYITGDPIGLEGGMNVYAYVNGNPVNWADPDGLARKGNKGDGSASGKNTSNPYKALSKNNFP
ncbi:hypothetical protein DENIS_3841 [Desulfonema ishimotonii]|uniref:Teneurin-like YD-shell domain-containing protein n=2 Tax=Desulfonema ishimotonii TaxID=45657 RepID=A0A401G0X9_9BACT|nr:hypothetical protein DENIS_3841 [Desulfonema ishimotonii]